MLIFLPISLGCISLFYCGIFFRIILAFHFSNCYGHGESVAAIIGCFSVATGKNKKQNLTNFI